MSVIDTCTTLRFVPDPVLRMRARKIADFDEELLSLASSMVRVMMDNAGVGLAANQVGVLRRLIVIRVGENEALPFANPSIAPLTEETDFADEACLSVPFYTASIERYAAVKLSAQMLDGEPIEIPLDGVFARIAQHEVDHLDGVILPIKRASARRDTIVA